MQIAALEKRFQEEVVEDVKPDVVDEQRMFAVRRGCVSVQVQFVP